jgi:hypothetical protein
MPISTGRKQDRQPPLVEALAGRRVGADRLEADPRGRGPEALIFFDENGNLLDLCHFADLVRTHLAAAKLDCADLYSRGSLKGRFGTDCFRRSFVTRSPANGGQPGGQQMVGAGGFEPPTPRPPV